MFITFYIQCDAIRYEQFLQRCRLGQRNMVIGDEDSIIDQIYEKQIFSDLNESFNT